jgi:hypothetical protein
MIDWTAREFFILIGGGGVLTGLIFSIAFGLYLAYTTTDVMLDHLKNSSSAKAFASLRHGGPLGKLLMVGGISGLLTLSDFHLKRGGLSSEDVINFPAQLKLKLKILYWSLVVFSILLFLLGGIGKVLGWLK